MSRVTWAVPSLGYKIQFNIALCPVLFSVMKDNEFSQGHCTKESETGETRPLPLLTQNSYTTGAETSIMQSSSPLVC